MFTNEISSRYEFDPVSGQSSYMLFTHFRWMKSHPGMSQRQEWDSPQDEIHKNMHVNTSSWDEMEVKTRVNKINFSSRLKLQKLHILNMILSTCIRHKILVFHQNYYMQLHKQRCNG